MAPTFVFILVELLDIITTSIGHYIQCWELNSIGFSFRTIYYKLIITVCVAGVLYLKPKRKIDWVIPIVAGLAIPWNILVILAEIIKL